MKKYRIKFITEIEEISDGDDNTHIDSIDFESVKYMSEDEASSIDDVEMCVLETAYSAMRGTLSRHFTEISKKKP